MRQLINIVESSDFGWTKEDEQTYQYKSDIGEVDLLLVVVNHEPLTYEPELINLEVPKKLRRKGYGKELVRICADKAKELGYDRLWVQPEETRLALSFWRSFRIGKDGGYLNTTTLKKTR